MIPGEAPSQGSMKAFPFKKKNGKMGVNQVHQDDKGIKEFRKNTMNALSDVYKDFYTDNIDVAFCVEVVFYIEKPITVKRPFPTGRFDKDLDKRIRALLDALTKSDSYNPYGIFDDDSQVVKISAVKKYAVPCDTHKEYNESCEKCKNGLLRTDVKVSKIYDTKEMCW